MNGGGEEVVGVVDLARPGNLKLRVRSGPS